jgi:hypothetical protein
VRPTVLYGALYDRGSTLASLGTPVWAVRYVGVTVPYTGPGQDANPEAGTRYVVVSVATTQYLFAIGGSSTPTSAPDA